MFVIDWNADKYSSAERTVMLRPEKWPDSTSPRGSPQHVCTFPSANCAASCETAVHDFYLSCFQKYQKKSYIWSRAPWQRALEVARHPQISMHSRPSSIARPVTHKKIIPQSLRNLFFVLDEGLKTNINWLCTHIQAKAWNWFQSLCQDRYSRILMSRLWTLQQRHLGDCKMIQLSISWKFDNRNNWDGRELKHCQTLKSKGWRYEFDRFVFDSCEIGHFKAIPSAHNPNRPDPLNLFWNVSA